MTYGPLRQRPSPRARCTVRFALMLPLVLAAAVCASTTRASEFASQFAFADLGGAWRVAGVAVMPTDVQALGPDDPSLMGARVLVSADAITWLGRPGDPDDGDRCEGPVTQRLTGASRARLLDRMASSLIDLGLDPAELSDPHAVECLSNGALGPQAAGGALLLIDPEGHLVMSWYDGAVLLLKRE